MEQKVAWGEIFELGRGINYSIQEIAEMFEYDNIVYEPNKPGEADITLCEDTKAKDMLGWVPVKTIEEYIKTYLNENINNTASSK